MKYLNLPGINIQWPWSELLLTGQKTVETRSYSLPSKYKNQWLAVIETPGPRGPKEAGINKARIRGLIQFQDSFGYPNRAAWLADYSRHLVPPDDTSFAFDPNKSKWGWLVTRVVLFSDTIEPPKRRGIVFASVCKIPVGMILNRSTGIWDSSQKDSNDLNIN